MTEQRNPALLEAARVLHSTGRIEADTYIIDQDVVAANAQALAEIAAKHAVEPWFVSKQFGRSPTLIKTVAAHIPQATAIDVREARAVLRAGAELGNVGHLVQIPIRALPDILAAAPAYVTVFDLANLQAVAKAATAAGHLQRVLLRISGDAETTYPGQEGGIELPDIPAVLDAAAAMEGVKVVGVTGFPCVILDPERSIPQPTSTAHRVLSAADMMRRSGVADPVVDLPSHSSCSTIPLVAELGGTHVEPGHALTGTTPEHAIRDDLAERPAIVYISEIAQTGTKPALFGGGFYPRGRARNVIVGDRRRARRGTLVDTPAENIDYYRRVRLPDTAPLAELGEVALMAFRTQIFVTRSRVAVVSGIQSGSPVVDGTFDAFGTRLLEA